MPSRSVKLTCTSCKASFVSRTFHLYCAGCDLDEQVRAQRLAPGVREYRFTDLRKWRFDRAWPEHWLAMEIEGGVWTGGRHTRGAGFVADCEKYNAATLAGWKVLRVPTEQVRNGEAAKLVKAALRGTHA